MTTPSARFKSRNPLEIVSSLRAAVRSGEPEMEQVVAGRLDAIEGAISRVLAEHSGMADELLRAYEQLGIVFEVTRQLPEVNTEREVLRLFVNSLQTTYPRASVEVVEANEAGELAVCRRSGSLPDWVRAALADCRDQRQVVVADNPACQVEGAFPRCDDTSSARRPDGIMVRVMCGPIHAGDDLSCALLLGQSNVSDRDTSLRPFDTSDMLLLESLNTFCGDMIRNFRLLAELRQLSVDMVRALISAVEQKDEYTSGHSTRVGRYAVLLGEALGLEAAELQMLEWSALLHDVGKIGIRDTVLKKPGKLTSEEFEHIKEHPCRSYDVVRKVPQLAAALDGVLHHHEHWDGSGYPAGLVGEGIPLMARIIQVADVFDALTSTRSYRQSFGWSRALEIIDSEAGTTVDPDLARVFGALIRRLADEEPERLRDIMSELRSGTETGANCAVGGLPFPAKKGGV